MTNTQGLDALAALCGSAAAGSNPAAAPEEAAAANANAPGGAPSLYAQQQMQAAHQHQHQQQVQALQLQQVQQVLAMRQAQAAAAAQQQQQQPVAAPAMPAQGALPPQLQSLLMAQQQQQQPQQQQLAGYNQVQTQALVAQLLAAQQQQHPLANQGPASVHHPGLAAAGLPPAALAGLGSASGQILPGASTLSQFTSSSPTNPMSPSLQQTATAGTKQAHLSSPSTIAMPPPPTKVVPSLPISNPRKIKARRASADSLSGRTSTATAAAQPPIQDIITEWEGKKTAKRAANRLSAHLSRKRKKMFIEDLKDENVELRRKELILRSIPDLIVVFDSSGCISFVSHSVTRFLDHTSEELEYTSFWDLLTEDSVRLIKSAFMDALAVKRHPEEDSTPLGNGESIMITLVHKDEDGKEEAKNLLVSLKGVVHFAGESPECVCSIRPERSTSSIGEGSKTSHKKAKTASSQIRQERAVPVPVGVPPSHQISDIDSEQS